MATADKENPLSISWHDSNWIPILNRENVMAYFMERSNPFYDRQCNNETIKMQRLSNAHLEDMVGIEYVLFHCQEPILYVIRKQNRTSPTQVTPLTDYYIVAGWIYQAPDLKSLVNSRLTTSLYHIQSAFTEASSYSRYHPSKGYWWQFKEETDNKKPIQKNKKKEEPGSMFQIRRVDQLLAALTVKFPHKYYQANPGEKPLLIPENQKQTIATSDAQEAVKTATTTAQISASVTVKSEPAVPEKRGKFM